MIGKKAVFALSISAVALSGCAPFMNITVKESDALPMTARYFGVSEKEIKIKNFKKGWADSGFQAIYKGQLYNCDLVYDNVRCVKPGTTGF